MPIAYDLEDKLAIAKRVCARVADGQLVCDVLKDEGLPPTHWWNWQEENKEIRADFGRARVAQAHALAERAVIVSRNVRGEDHHIVQAVRLECDTLRWFTSKIAPKLYGERIEVGGEGFRIGVIALPAEKSEEGGEGDPPLLGESRSLGLQSGAARESVTNSGDVPPHGPTDAA